MGLELGTGEEAMALTCEGGATSLVSTKRGTLYLRRVYPCCHFALLLNIHHHLLQTGRGLVHPPQLRSQPRQIVLVQLVLPDDRVRRHDVAGNIEAWLRSENPGLGFHVDHVVWRGEDH